MTIKNKTLPASEIKVRMTFELPELYNVAEVLYEDGNYELSAKFYAECAKAGLSNGLYSLIHLYQQGWGNVTLEDLEKSSNEFFQCEITAEPVIDYELSEMVELKE